MAGSEAKSLIVICTEPDFETASRLLVRSIRAFAGPLASLPIYSYSPRRGMLPSSACRDDFRRHGVESIEIPLNHVAFGYGFGNKIFAATHAEATFPDARIIFLDSDTVVFAPPTELVIGGAGCFAASPVYWKNIGIADFDDIEGRYWTNIYDICGAIPSRKVYTRREGRQIFEYFNAGMCAAQSSDRLFATWLHNFETVWSSDVRPLAGEFFVEQSLLSATVTACIKKVSLLSDTYHISPDILWTADHDENCHILRTAVSLHYGQCVKRKGWSTLIDRMGPYVDRGRIEWLKANLHELRLI